MFLYVIPNLLPDGIRRLIKEVTPKSERRPCKQEDKKEKFYRARAACLQFEGIVRLGWMIGEGQLSPHSYWLNSGLEHSLQLYLAAWHDQRPSTDRTIQSTPLPFPSSFQNLPTMGTLKVHRPRGKVILRSHPLNEDWFLSDALRQSS